VIITFRAEGAEDLVWPGFKPDRLMTTEAEAIEKVTGLAFAAWGAALMKGSASAGRALVWVLRKRTDPTLRYRDVDFPIGDLSIGFDEDELAAIRTEVETNRDLTDEQRAEALAALGEPADDEDPGGPGNDPGPPATGSASAGT
jgi:hypothetical protein